LEAYHAKGYDFVVLTDHFLAQYGFPITDTRSLRSADFTTLLGAELHAPGTESGLNWQLVAAGLPLDFASPSPASAIILSGSGVYAEQLHGDGLTRASFSLDRFGSSYCRLTVRDRAGKRAWSNPVWLTSELSVAE
jgi:hypothetical protein